ncbi:hypothetical protein GCM10009787_50920 [Streptomyces bangladeshensis]|uniref:Uncharacterized protein n=1 Tax=Streptomyces bangladeshensis TaxID=295352 RepID=A0ABN3BUE7_9ACTN
MVPPRAPLPGLPRAVSSGIPPATAAVANAVKTRKPLRLGRQQAETAFGVIASTPSWRTRTPGGGPSAAVFVTGIG